MKRHIPNLLTATNLFCGALATTFVVTGNVLLVTFLVLLALVMDFGDGLVARALGVSSPIGKELDSLADNVTFGLVPALVMSRLIGESQGAFSFAKDWEPGLYLAGLLIAVFSALRLAKFNLDTRQSENFYGLPTPANAIFILSLWLVLEYESASWMAGWLENTWVLLGLTLFSCALLVADLRLIALKFKSLAFRPNLFRYLLLVSGMVLLVLFRIKAIPFVILLYILLSLLENWLSGRQTSSKN